MGETYEELGQEMQLTFNNKLGLDVWMRMKAKCLALSTHKCYTNGSHRRGVDKAGRACPGKE